MEGYRYMGIDMYFLNCYSKVKGCTFKTGMPTLFNFTVTCEPTFERYFCMIHMVVNIWKSNFSCNKRDIF
jgi:hypothetical protein